MIEALNRENETNSRKNTGIQNPLFQYAHSETISSIESREIEQSTNSNYNRKSMNNQSVKMSVLNFKFTVKAKTYSDYKKISTIALPYLLLLFLLVILFSVFKIDIFLGSQTKA